MRGYLRNKPLTVKIEESICELDLEQYWLGMFMQAGSYQEEISPKRKTTFRFLTSSLCN